MYTLTLTAALTEIDDRGNHTADNSKRVDIGVSGSDLDDIRMIMANCGPATAFTTAIERLLAEAEMRQRQSAPAAAAKEPTNGVATIPPPVKRKGKNRVAGPAGPEVGAVPVVDSPAPVAPTAV